MRNSPTTVVAGSSGPIAQGLDWLLAGVLPPTVAFALQWGLWPMLDPLLWFLFYPAVFVSSWLGGLRAGALGTVVSIAYVFGFFASPTEFQGTGTSLLFSTVAFFVMGLLFAAFHDRLHKANRAARSAIVARDEFLQIASHELKTPLTPLQLELDGLQRAFARTGVRDEKMNARLELATRQTLRLERLVGSLLDVSTIAGGQLELDLERCDLSALVHRVAHQHQHDAVRAGSKLEVIADAPLIGEWDRTRVEQIVDCLLSNAIKYGAGQPITVEVRAAPGRVSVSISDRGIGIRAQELQRIFGRFERGVSLRNYGGLGFGLYIARGLAEAHGGSLDVESRPDYGSTFRLLLPLRPVSALRPVLDATAEAQP